VENATTGTTKAKSKLAMASFLRWQYHNPAPGRIKLSREAFVECFIATSLPFKRVMAHTPRIRQVARTEPLLINNMANATLQLSK